MAHSLKKQGHSKEWQSGKRRSMNDMTKKLIALNEHAQAAECAQVPEVDAEGGAHWSGTLEEIRAEWPCYFDKAGRCTNDKLISCLSLSRCFGPVPSLTPEEGRQVMAELWPAGNPCGQYMEWGTLADKLWNECARPRLWAEAEQGLSQVTQIDPGENDYEYASIAIDGYVVMNSSTPDIQNVVDELGPAARIERVSYEDFYGKS